MKLGDISVAFAELLQQSVLHLGADPQQQLAQYQLDAVKLSSPQARISIPRYMRLGQACIEAHQLPHLGLEMGVQSGPGHLGLAGLLAQTAATIKHAAQAFTEFELLSSFNARGQSCFYLDNDSGEGVLQFYSISPYNQYNLFVVDSVLGGWANLLTSFVESGGLNNGHKNTAIIRRIELEFDAPDYREAYAQYWQQRWGCELVFGAEQNAVILPAWALELRVNSRCSSTHQALRQAALQELEKVRLGLSFRETTERAISPLLNGQTPTLEQVAHRMNLAPWTVRRRLKSEGISFQQLLNDTRQQLALSYVRDTRLSLGEIAYLLGFGSTAAFQRAFKRWNGDSPGRVREQLRST